MDCNQQLLLLRTYRWPKIADQESFGEQKCDGNEHSTAYTQHRSRTESTHSAAVAWEKSIKQGVGGLETGFLEKVAWRP
eukprot:scaffold341_cov154-Ochromonas_danica.AAC.3